VYVGVAVTEVAGGDELGVTEVGVTVGVVVVELSTSPATTVEVDAGASVVVVVAAVVVGASVVVVGATVVVVVVVVVVVGVAGVSVNCTWRSWPKLTSRSW
jgi:hypothetical protein